jgi:hypothetical protein
VGTGLSWNQQQQQQQQKVAYMCGCVRLGATGCFSMGVCLR